MYHSIRCKPFESLNRQIPRPALEEILYTSQVANTRENDVIKWSESDENVTSL